MQMILLFVGALVISGVITLQVYRSRPAAPVASSTPAPVDPGTAPPPALVVAPPPALAVAPPPALAVAPPAPITQGLDPAPLIVSNDTAPGDIDPLPAGQWGRNPFLTLEEIAALEPRPELVFIDVPTPVLPPPTIEPNLPTYTVSVILSGEDGAWAVVDARLVRQGDRLGTETVARINHRGIVLEFNGRTREIPIQSPSVREVFEPQGSNQ